MGKMGSICHFPRALPASIWGHCSQVLVFTRVWGTQKERAGAVFPSIWVSWDPDTLQNKGKTLNDKSTLFYPPPHPRFSIKIDPPRPPPRIPPTFHRPPKQKYGITRHVRQGIIWGTEIGKDQKGLHKRGTHDQGDFWKFPLEITV